MIVRDLERIDGIIDRIKRLPESQIIEITAYNSIAIGRFQESLRRAIKRYRKESARVRRHYIRH